MSPHHQGYVRELRTTTALRLSAAWLASDNIRRVREARGEQVNVVTDVHLRDEITGAIILSGIRPAIAARN